MSPMRQRAQGLHGPGRMQSPLLGRSWRVGGIRAAERPGRREGVTPQSGVTYLQALCAEKLSSGAPLWNRAIFLRQGRRDGRARAAQDWNPDG